MVAAPGFNFPLLSRGGNVKERHHICELAYLREGEAHLHGGFQLYARKKRSESAVEEFAENDKNGQKENYRQILPARGRIHEKPDGDEEYGGEHIPERLHKRPQAAANANTSPLYSFRSHFLKKLAIAGLKS